MYPHTPVYGWAWNDEPDFALPHADHITIEKVWMNSENISEDSEEMCIIVLRHPFSKDKGRRAEAERRAVEICDAMNLAKVLR
jgi:hypothetical protein